MGRGVLLYTVAAVGYLGVGVYLYLTLGYINPDASSRVGNAAFTILSRDPHLGAIGFVWNPLPSLVEIPLVAAFEHWPFTRWPTLRQIGFEGAIMSAMFMAGAVWQVRRIALDYRVGVVLRWTAVAAFALNPMIVLYAGLGMSEAPFLFFLLWACRRILRWVHRHHVADLVWAGAALGLGYLTRYEVLPAAIAVITGVAVVSTLRHRPGGRAFGVHDAVIVGLPTITAFVLWAALGWILDGNAFSQFSSQYGNAAQVAVAGIVTAGEVGTLPLLKVIAAGMLGMQPLVIAVAVVVAWMAVRRRALDAAVVATIFGSVLAFQMVAVLAGSTFGWFRFYIAATPLVVIALIVVAGTTAQAGTKPAVAARLPAVLMVAVLATSVPVGVASMLNPAIGKEEYGLRSAIWPQQYPRESYWFYWFGDVARNVAGWLDAQHLPRGSVLVDTFGLARIWLYSNDPTQFVIRSDYDFFSKLNAPAARGVQYIVSPRPSGFGRLDAINIRYPTLWEDGAQIATLTMTVVGPDGTPQFRLYRVS